MDRRSWPWKKKTIKETFATADSVAVSSGNDGKNQDQSKNPINYIQLSLERYAHLCEMEYQVKDLHGKLSDAMSELTNKENLVKLQSKVAEEAISGWDKAEAEASTLKSNLESTILLKTTAEDKAVKLDGALKECMKQVECLKEENEKTLTDVVSTKNKELEDVKFEFEMKLDAFEQELLRCTSENEALSRLVQDHCSMLKKIGEERSQAEAEIEAMKANIQSYKIEISSLKYEVHVVSKELEIRNEEKNMCVRSTEAANRQHLEDVKKIANLESECQRLRGFVRKKLPGPSALAQMKQEVESSVRDEKESKPRGSPSKGTISLESAQESKPKGSPAKGAVSLESAQAFSTSNDVQYFRRANEFLTGRLVAMEEEINILKEALSKRNTEVLASREKLAETATKLKIVETQMQVQSQQKCSSDFATDILLSKMERNQRSLTSMSDDGIDEGSCTESWGTTSISQLPQLWKGCTAFDKFIKTSSDQLDLMDDFLAMEKLACLSTEDNDQNLIAIENSIEVRSQKVLLSNCSPSKENVSMVSESGKNETLLAKLRLEITTIFESHSKDTNIREVLADIKKILQSMEELSESMGSATNNVYFPKTEILKKTILQIHDFVASLYKNVTGIQNLPTDVYEYDQKVQEFTSSLDNIMSTEPSIQRFLQALSIILCEEELCLKKFWDKYNEGERNSPDCVEKVTLLEKKAVVPELRRHGNTDSSSDSEVCHERRTCQNSDKREKFNSWGDIEQLKLKNDGLRSELNRSNEILEQAKQELLQAEEQKSVLKMQLTECQELNSLATTQLKCMTESYKFLESRCHELENEIQILRIKIETSDNELKEERKSCQYYLEKYKDLHEQIQRKEKNSVVSEKDTAMKINHEKEFAAAAAAAEKLTECQETIDLLGKQLKTLQPETHLYHTNARERDNNTDGLQEIIEKVNEYKTQGCSKPRVENLGSILQRSGCESPFDTYSCHFSPSKIKSSSVSPASSKRPKHRSTWSCSSNSSNLIDEKHGRGGFIRFFTG